jgi:hypothetical protein
VRFGLDDQAVVVFFGELLRLPFRIQLAALSELGDGVFECPLVRNLLDAKTGAQMAEPKFIGTCQKGLAVNTALTKLCFECGGIG